jgi:hypothetical protein
VSVLQTSLLLQFGGVPATQPTAGSQVSTPLQTLLSLHCSGIPVHVPLVQTSPVVHAEPSLHAVPSAAGVWTQPVPGLQLSSVQELPSSQVSPAPATHVPVVGVFGVLQLDVAVHWSAEGHTTPP